MSKLIKIAFFIGIVMTITGGFLLWDHRIFYWTNWWAIGLADFIFDLPGIFDDSGFFTIVLSVLLILHTLRPVNFLVRPMVWNIMLGVTLVGVALYSVNEFLNMYIVAHDKPTIGAELLMMIFGSIILLLTAIFSHRRDISDKNGLAERFDQMLIVEEREYIAADPSWAEKQDFLYKDLKIGYFAGILLTMLGSFLPWWERYAFSTVTYCGVQPPFCFTFHQEWVAVVDNYGGWIIAVLSAILFVMQFCHRKAALDRIMWNNILACSVFTLSGYYFSRFLSSHVLFLPISNDFVDGFKLGLKIGLELVLWGSSLLLLTALTQYRRNL
ncbi:MAG: hypothetical protein WA821_12665 [Anaerolineales bacterium]